MYHKSDYCYDLPDEKIAQTPVSPRSHSKLLIPSTTINGAPFLEKKFHDLPHFLRAGDVLVFNDTKVNKARLIGKKISGGRAEVFIESIINATTAKARCKLSHAKVGTVIELVGGTQLRLEEKIGESWRISATSDVALLMHTQGHIPIPPYLLREDTPMDGERYQTVYARHEGAVAAPTAGLHFDAPLLKQLEERGIASAFVTLHVGAGTFVPLRHDDIRDHTIHEERFEVSAPCIQTIHAARARGGRVIAVGTTTLRALETAALLHGELQAYQGKSNLFVQPGFRFRVVDALITNFHQSASTLLILVSAFAGHALIREAYRYALAHDFRFLSYGDAMLLLRAPSP